jgi:hypothetical protein
MLDSFCGFQLERFLKWGYQLMCRLKELIRLVLKGKMAEALLGFCLCTMGE